MSADGPVFKRWQASDDDYIRAWWGKKPLTELAAVLGRTDDAVKQRAYRVMGTTLDQEAIKGRSKGRRIPL